MAKLTRENLIELGFKEEFVPTEESGDKPYKYYVYEVLDEYNNEKCLLISNEYSEDEPQLFVEFFHLPEIGFFEDYQVVKELINIIKKAK